jgi:hypothetical protein
MAKKKRKKAKRAIAETDLHEPVAKYLRANGYKVRSEVEGCDITAVRGEDLIIIELKRRFDTKLLVQAAQRQRITDSVYVALPRPDESLWSKRWREIQHLLKRLELGLILVSFRGRNSSVEVVFHPVAYVRRKRKSKKRAVLREIEARSGDYNLGGSVGRKLVTAYRENAIHVACALEKFGPLSPKHLVKLGTGPKTYSILYDNHYGWFDRIGRGLYELKPQGRAELASYGKLAAHYRRLLKKHKAPQ